MGVSIRPAAIDEIRVIDVTEASHSFLLRDNLTVDRFIMLLCSIIDSDVSRYFVEHVIETGEYIYRIEFNSGDYGMARGLGYSSRG